MFKYKIWKHDGEVLVAVSDIDILGKTFSNDELSIEVSRDFYEGKIINEAEIKELLKTGTIINAVGNKIISLLIEEDVVEEKNVLKIGEIKHAQVFVIK